MEFDISRFTGTKFQPREEAVAVPDLKDFFSGDPEKDDAGNDKPPAWTVRGLTGPELASVNEAQARNRNKGAIAEALVSSKDARLTEAVRELIGAGETLPDDMAKRIEMLVVGSVAPECDHTLAVHLANAFPVEFYQLTTKITQLTGMGGEPGKPRRSSGTRKSASPSSSAT